MRELKPKLMMTSSGRRRRGPSGGFWSFLTFVIVFLVGVYVGTKIDDFNFGGTGSVPVKQAKDEESKIDGKKTVKYETSTEPVISEDENPPDETASSTNEKVLPTDGKNITEELIKSSPEMSVKANDSSRMGDTGLTAINHAQMSGEAKTLEEVHSASPAEPTQGNENSGEKVSENSPKNGYTLQVGAFSEKARAEKAVSEYRSKGFNAYTIQVQNSKGETWNLVKVGKYSSIEEAWGQSALFKRTVGKDAYVESLGTKTVFNESWGKNE